MIEREHENPETAYRRGYQQGAYDALVAAKRLPITQLFDWVERSVAAWRFSQTAEDRNVRPPKPD